MHFEFAYFYFVLIHMELRRLLQSPELTGDSARTVAREYMPRKALGQS